MRYAIVCYDDESIVWNWSKDKEAAVMESLGAVTGRLRKAGVLGPVLRLMPTTTATTVRKGTDPLVLDGPFAETKEQLLGLYLLDVETYEEAVAIAGELAKVSGSAGCYEVRPLALFMDGRG